MNKRCWLAGLLFLLVATAEAAEVFVEPGTETLQNAIVDAVDGDTLVLYDGAYIGSVITIDKSLTIRAIARGAVAYVSNTINIQGEGIKVTLQGLTLDGQLNIKQGQDVKILENTFLANHDLSAFYYQTAEGDGDLAIIGNRFESGGDILNIRSNDAYIAGNYLVQGKILADGGPVWVVGNEVHSPSNLFAIQASTAGEARIIANRIHQSTSVSGGHIIAVYVTGPVALISGNIVSLSTLSASTFPYISGIHASNMASITNNLVHWDSGLPPYYASSVAIYANTGRIAGNIVNGFPRVAISTSTAQVENNLCFEVGSACGSSADGNLTADPGFVDEVDFELSAGSPAIDAGPDDAFFADLDRTRNDMGAYGGPWSIGQYDAQRDPDYIGPYVYPLFKASASINDGFMNIRALGVARLR